MNDNNDLTAKINIVPGDTDQAAAQLEAFNQRIVGMRQRTDTLNKGFEDLQKIKLDNLKNEFKSVENASENIGGSQRKLADLRKRIEEVKNEFRSGAKDTDRFAKELSELEQQARKLDSALDAVGERRRINLDTGNLDFQDAAQIDKGERLRTIGRDIRNLPSIQTPLGVGTDTFGRAAEVAGRLGVSVGQLAVGFGVAAAAAIPVAIGINALNESMKKQVEQLNAAIEANRKVGQDVAGGKTAAEAEVRLKEIARLREAESKVLRDNEALYRNSVEGLNDYSEFFKRVFDPLEDKLAEQIGTSRSIIQGLTTEEEALIAARAEGRLATNDAAAELEKLAEKEKELTKQRQDGIDKIQTLNDQEADLNKKFNDQQIRDMIDRARQSARVDEAYKLRDLRAEEDHNRQLEKLNKSHQDQITKTAENGQKQVGDALDALEKKDADIAEKRVDALEEFNEKIADADAKYRKQAEKDAIEFGRRRREIENDFQRSASEARLDFDVRGFKDAQDEQKRELADLKTDRKDAKSERLDELAEEREATAENHNERLEQLDEELQKAREQTAERIIQIQQQTEEQLVSSALTHQERLKEDADTRQITRERELEDRKILADQQKVDLDILLARQKTANDSQIQHLNDLELKELAIYYERDAQLTALLEKEKLLTTGLGGTSGKPASNNWWDMLPTVPTTGDYPVLPDAPITPGGVGGDKLLNPNSLTRRSPLANPAAFAANPGGASGRSGGVNTTYQINMTVGEHVTKKDLDKIKKTIRDTQSETVAGIELAFFEGKKVIR